jgi:hypothetical protein
VAYLSYYLHWSHGDLLELEHRDRREWVRQVAAINSRINQTV